MKSNWETRPLGELVKFSSGGTPSKKNPEYWNGTIPWISAKTMKDERISTSDLMITEDGLASGSKLAPIGSLLLLTRGSGLFNGIPLCIVEQPVAFNQDVKCIESCTDVSNQFIFYWLKSQEQYLKAKLEVTGIGAGKFDTKFLQELNVPVPPKEERDKIVAIAEALSKKIIVNAKINDNLQQQLTAIFREWFIDAPESAEWPRGTFADLIDHTTSGDWGKDAPTGNYTEMVYCIRGADIPEVKAGNKGKMPTRFILPKNYAAKKLVDGDIVVEISGGSPTQSTGRAAPVSESLLGRYDRGMVCTNFCKAIKPKRGYSMFVYHYWQHLYDAGVFFGYENGTTGIKNLDISGFIETEEIVLPPFDIVERFDTVCQTIANKVYANGLENERLANLRDALLPRLMSGEIDVASIKI